MVRLLWESVWVAHYVSFKTKKELEKMTKRNIEKRARADDGADDDDDVVAAKYNGLFPSLSLFFQFVSVCLLLLQLLLLLLLFSNLFY